MMETKRKSALFGGALRCAGLAAMAMSSPAMADFIAAAPAPGYGPNYTFAYAADAAGNLVNQAYVDGTAVFSTDIAYSGVNGDINAYSGPSIIGASVSPSGASAWTYALGAAYQWFTVDGARDVSLEWDFGAYDGFEIGLLAYVDGAATILAQETLGAGSMDFSLSPGTLYVFFGRAATSGLAGDSFVRLVQVPAPGALALLGLGLVAGRRRRRE